MISRYNIRNELYYKTGLKENIFEFLLIKYIEFLVQNLTLLNDFKCSIFSNSFSIYI